MNLIDHYNSLTTCARARWAARAGISPNYLYLVATGRRVPSAALCVRLEQACDGAVSRMGMRDDAHVIWG